MILDQKHRKHIGLAYKHRGGPRFGENQT